MEPEPEQQASPRAWPLDRLDALILLTLFVAAGTLHAPLAFRTLHPLIDCGRDLYVPELITRGGVLYRDIAYYYPPLTPYLLALLTSVLGHGLVSYVILGAAIATLSGAAIYVLLRTSGSRLAASTATTLFLLMHVVAAGGYSSNQFFPYAHAATLGMLFLLIETAALNLMAWRGPHLAWSAVAVVAATAALWTKIELAVIAAALLLLMVITNRLRARILAGYAVAAGLSLGVWATLLRGAAPGRHWLDDNVFASALLHGPAARHFYQRVTGLAFWKESLSFSITSSLLIIAAIGAMVLIGRTLQSRGASRRTVLLVALGLALLLSIVPIAGARLFRSWTVLQLLLLLPAIRRPQQPLTLLLALSLACSSRIFFNLEPLWYGFVYAVPVVVLMVYVFLEWLPTVGGFRRELAMAWLAPLLLTGAHYSGLARTQYAANAYPVETTRGTFFVSSSENAGAYRSLFQHLRQTDTRTMAVVPEGLTLNYLASIPTPLYFHTFTPAENLDATVEREVVADWMAHPPERVVVVPRDLREFGSRGFGVDYDRQLMATLRRLYRVERVIPAGNNRVLTVLVRRAAGSAQRSSRSSPAPGSPELASFRSSRGVNAARSQSRRQS